jgi:hypothetical protein
MSKSQPTLAMHVNLNGVAGHHPRSTERMRVRRRTRTTRAWSWDEKLTIML